MAQDPWPNLASLFFEQAAKLGDRPFMWSKHDGQYRPQTWTEVADEVKAVSRGLRALGVKPGHRVMLVSENRPNWVVADLAIMAAGAITVPAYTTNTEALHEHIITDSGAKVAIVSTAALAARLLPAAKTTGAAHVVAMEPVEPHDGIDVMTWEALKERGEAEPDDVEEVAATVERGHPACFIYTSGTGGLPKGVILSHHALLSNIRSIRIAFEPILSGTEIFLSFLPLSHSYEHTCGFLFPISIGAEIYYAEGADTLTNNMVEVSPTIMTCVPRLYEVMRQRILAGVARQGGSKEKLFNKTLTLGLKKVDPEQSLGLGEKLTDMLMERLVREKVRQRFGGRLKAMVSGGAPLNPDVGKFFNALGVTLLQGYGQTESAPVVSCNPPGGVKMHTVGTALPEVEVKIADDGEILVRGGLVMDGYWNNPETTAETIQDGWLHTGDIGVIDADGYLQITDRKKDIIVNSGGDNLAPQRVEGILTLEPEIAQAMVVGDKRPHLVALLVPDEAFIKDYAKAEGAKRDLAALADDKGLHAALRDAVDRANQKLSQIEKVKRYMVAAEPFTVENNQMTPTLKVRRHVVKDIYGDRLEALYG
ncbi:MAG: AMP-dependent synthetase/ligase [Pseudomonadota bacterium]